MQTGSTSAPSIGVFSAKPIRSGAAKSASPAAAADANASAATGGAQVASPG